MCEEEVCSQVVPLYILLQPLPRLPVLLQCTSGLSCLYTRHLPSTPAPARRGTYLSIYSPNLTPTTRPSGAPLPSTPASGRAPASAHLEEGMLEGFTLASVCAWSCPTATTHQQTGPVSTALSPRVRRLRPRDPPTRRAASSTCSTSGIPAVCQ